MALICNKKKKRETLKMSPCYYCGSKHHTIRQCNVDWREFVIWEDMFNIEVGYWGEINCNTLWSLKKKTLMRIASLEKVSLVQNITPDSRNITCSPVNIKLNQDKEKLINAIVDRYNKNKEVVEELRNKQSVDTNEDCPICYDKLGDAVCTTKCGHKFCTDCFVLTIRRLPQGACCPMCRASLIPKPENRQAAGGRTEFENSRNREQQDATGLLQGNITAEEERWDWLNRDASEAANRYSSLFRERPVNISWSVDRNPDHDRRYFNEEGHLRRQRESVRDREEEEVGF